MLKVPSSSAPDRPPRRHSLRERHCTVLADRTRYYDAAENGDGKHKLYNTKHSHIVYDSTVGGPVSLCARARQCTRDSIFSATTTPRRPVRVEQKFMWRHCVRTHNIIRKRTVSVCDTKSAESIPTVTDTARARRFSFSTRPIREHNYFRVSSSALPSPPPDHNGRLFSFDLVAELTHACTRKHVFRKTICAQRTACALLTEPSIIHNRNDQLYITSLSIRPLL